MTQDDDQPRTTSALIDEAGDAPPSAASAGAPDTGEGGEPLVPVTAWTSPEDCEALAKGLTNRASPAEWAFARLSRMVQDFESKLDQEHEIGVTFVGSPGDNTMRIDDMGFWAPDLILFYGPCGWCSTTPTSTSCLAPSPSRWSRSRRGASASPCTNGSKRRPPRGRRRRRRLRRLPRTRALVRQGFCDVSRET